MFCWVVSLRSCRLDNLESTQIKNLDCLILIYNPNIERFNCWLVLQRISREQVCSCTVSSAAPLWGFLSRLQGGNGGEFVLGGWAKS